ncbi:30S ribosomal protein S18 [Mycoplasmopsis lipofaciens]|uniref:30S ribosomal protein S18 n=1 Tax=Mycoplasmopsis lipofaciens TaxID=114884 RepID=UPI0004878E92|nr:30S ribosomal protein S18 [Mycoplasmopsis lipofaciens]
MAHIRPKKTTFIKRRRCQLCDDKINYVDYKDVEFLEKFIAGNGQIKPHAATGTCAKDQRKIASAVKRARYMALIPYIKERVRVMK